MQSFRDCGDGGKEPLKAMRSTYETGPNGPDKNLCFAQ